ncbi:MAG: hypothetical protein K0R14_319 [Burkholderiales bacterium]|jgi:hypothetical protein|nr:hypothetical protein [Burkholderiales bacterium]
MKEYKMISGRNIAVLLKIIAIKGKPWNQQMLSAELEIPQSEISNSLKRLRQSRLLIKTNTTDIVALSACEEFFVHGFRYVFPLNRVGKGKGIVTSYAAPIFKDAFPTDENKPIWINVLGNDEGVGIEPLYDRLPEVVLKNPDKEFYNLLTTVDALREQRVRERNIAKEKFKIALDDYAKELNSYNTAH